MKTNIKTITLAEKDFNEFIGKITEKDIVFGLPVTTNSTVAKYFERYFLKDGEKVKIVLHLKDTEMSFKIPPKKENQASADKLKASFKFNENNETHVNIKKINDFSTKIAQEKLKICKEFIGCVQTQVKKPNEMGIDELHEVEPRIWVVMPPKDRKLNAEVCGCRVAITKFDGKTVRTDDYPAIKVQEFIKRCGFRSHVKSCHINFENFSLITGSLMFPCSFNIFNTILLMPIIQKRDDGLAEMKKELEKQAVMDNNINVIDEEAPKEDEFEITNNNEIDI